MCSQSIMHLTLLICINERQTTYNRIANQNEKEPE